MSQRIDLQTQVQGRLRRLHGGTGSEHGYAYESLLVPMVNDSNVGTFERGSVVTRTLANPKLHKATIAGQRIIGVVVGRFSTTTGEFEDEDVAENETAAVCVAGRCEVITDASPARDDWLTVSATDGQATPNATQTPNAFGFVIYKVSATVAQAIIGTGGGIAGYPAHSALSGLTSGDDHTQYQKESEKSAASGYASLNSSSHVPRGELGSGSDGSGDYILHDDGTWELEATYFWINFVISGGAAVPPTGLHGFVVVPAGTIVAARIGGLTSGSAQVDIKKDDWPPTSTTSICASAKPTLSTAQFAEDTTLTGWTTTLAEGDSLFFNLDSITTIKTLTVALKVHR